MKLTQRQALHPAVPRIARNEDRPFDDVPPRTWMRLSGLWRGHGRRREERLPRNGLGGDLPPVWIEPGIKTTWPGLQRAMDFAAEIKRARGLPSEVMSWLWQAHQPMTWTALPLASSLILVPLPIRPLLIQGKP